MKNLTKILTLDVETNTKHKGNPFTLDGKLVSVHTKVGGYKSVAHYEPWSKVVELIEEADLVIGFNIKFDLHWIRKVFGIVPKSVWDVQLAQFIMSCQEDRYPSLENTAKLHGFVGKIDKVKELWDQGIDTDQIDRAILTEYGNRDVDLTYDLFLKQSEMFNDKQQMFKLFRLHCNDLIVLQEMEYNGILYDSKASIVHAEHLQQQVIKVESELYEITGGVPINFNSTFHKSALLYGGTITQEYKLPIGVFKTGAKVGQTKYKTHEQVFNLPRLVEPLKGSELNKENTWSTDEPTLLSLKTNKVSKFIVTKLLERAGLVKLISTYLEGLPKLIEKMEWPVDMIHGNLNQCVAVTGRLSSTKPNMQNQPYEVKQFCVSRYDN